MANNSLPTLPKLKPPLPKINLKKVMPTNPQDFKCGASLEFENGSCYPLELLIDMANAFNKHSEESGSKDVIILYDDMDMLEPDNYKVYLLSEFKKRFEGSQKDWMNQQYVKFMEKDEKHYMKNEVFRPNGPQGKFEWLSTLDINKVLEQYESKYDDFKFLGAVPIDFNDLDYLPFKNMDFSDFQKNDINRLGVIFNLDEHNKSGSHWISLFADLKKGQIYFSDSYAQRPPQRVSNFISKIKNYINSTGNNKVDIKYNKTQHQKGNSECGVYSINFILRLLKGKTFEHITEKRLTDEQVNKCRNIYFGNKIK